MDKRAPTAHPVHDLVARRWSPVAFSAEPVTTSELATLLEAARWAASSFNEQPWRFVIATRDDAEAFARLASCLVPGNLRWAEHAPVLMLTVARTTFERNGKPNRHAWHDVGQAIATLTLQATALGLSVHQMAGFDAEQARELLAIPDGFEPVAMVAVGRHGDPAALGEDLVERESGARSRKALEEIAFAGVFGKPLGS